jgi:hypothetical protein
MVTLDVPLGGDRTTKPSVTPTFTRSRRKRRWEIVTLL